MKTGESNTWEMYDVKSIHWLNESHLSLLIQHFEGSNFYMSYIIFWFWMRFCLISEFPTFWSFTMVVVLKKVWSSCLDRVGGDWDYSNWLEDVYKGNCFRISNSDCNKCMNKIIYLLKWCLDDPLFKNHFLCQRISEKQQKNIFFSYSI